ncbi:anti-sigma factor family protein [Geodermatophilus marinus]|uniref:anti-sigma factor family protein n=1 Tax=Geodermatophilus sp. LHW52908 TaxID=2303986 RepID=UPI0018F3A493|nr:zf-HC2 domain-containing protein [Geodermatophilus sp. LHW52908]
MGEPRRVDGSGGDAVLEVACQEFVELVTEHLEGALPPAVERAVVAHLALCDPCVEYLAQVRATTAALAQLPPPTLPEPVRDQLLGLFGRLHPPSPGP